VLSLSFFIIIIEKIHHGSDNIKSSIQKSHTSKRANSRQINIMADREFTGREKNRGVVTLERARPPSRFLLYTGLPYVRRFRVFTLA